MQSVIVLTPRGRRQVVKIEPNKTVLWILEQVCIKFPEFQAENYDLKHHNKTVDLSQFFRFSGLPNNCTLEMVEADKKRVEKDVEICLQLDDNSRVNGSFQPSAFLIDILAKLAPEKSTSDQSPVIIYMRNEIYGDKLNTTTLKSIGLASGGRALLRLINSDPESLKVQANVSAPLPQKPKEEVDEVQYKPKQKVTSELSSSFQFQGVQQLNEPVKEEEVIEKEQKVDEEVKSVTQPIEEKKEIKEEIGDDNHVVEKEEPVINILDDRGTIIFSLDSMQTSSVDLPDSFFELTESDVRMLYRELRQQVDENENAPLMTAELRKLEENKKILNQLATYKSCALRIQLPDRHVIQTKFLSVEKIETVMDFVKEFLIDPEMKFYLFFTPPKIVLENDLSLVESKCVPSALLHFGCDEDVKEFLKPEYLEKLSSGFGASKVLLSTNRNSDNQPCTSGNAPSVPKNFMESKVSKPTSAMPKWFKPNK